MYRALIEFNLLCYIYQVLFIKFWSFVYFLGMLTRYTFNTDGLVLFNVFNFISKQKRTEAQKNLEKPRETRNSWVFLKNYWLLLTFTDETALNINNWKGTEIFLTTHVNPIYTWCCDKISTTLCVYIFYFYI